MARRPQSDGPKQKTWFGIPAEPERQRPAFFREEIAFEGHPFRIIYVKGEPWFVAAHVCEGLKINNVSDAVARLDDDEKSVLVLNDVAGRPNTTNVVNEPGLYALIFSSRKSETKPFKRWVCHEVLPAIRKNGCYGSPWSKVEKRARKNKCPYEAALERNKNVDWNKSLHAEMACYEAKRKHYKDVHNKLTFEQFGQYVSGMRKTISIPSWKTPLDYCDELPLIVNNLMKAVAIRALREEAAAGRRVPVDDLSEFMAARCRPVIEANLQVFGDGARFGPKEDPRWGRLIYDVVQGQITAEAASFDQEERF